MGGLKVLDQPQKSKIGAIFAVAAGKGGVGKSTVSVHLALALKKRGYKVGLLDADVYGPSLVQMLPVGMEPTNDPENPERLLPGLTFGIPFISVAHFKKRASIVRAPVANQIIEQFLSLVQWGDLDYLIVDFPPGTGDIQLTLMQKAPLAGALVVTTPQAVATLDVRKAMECFLQMHVPLLGIVENMSYLRIEGQDEPLYPFGKGGAEELSRDFSLPILAKIPIDPLISYGGDTGISLFEKEQGAKICDNFFQIADQLVQTLPLENELLVRKLSQTHLEFYFENRWHPISLYELQKMCPCARCEKQGKSEEGVSLLEFSPVGRYAIRIRFTSGCSQGIYPFSLIKSVVLV